MNKTDDFIKKCKKIHSDKYDYSLVNYKNSTTKIKIICYEHGVFEQLPNNHLKGQKCKKCYYDSKKINFETFIKKSKEIHGDKYDYSLVNYKNNRSKIKIICPKHGIFEQQLRHHVSGSDCNYCVKEKRFSTTKKFIKKSQNIHGNKYDYSLVNYIDAHTKVKIICSIHGIFEQIPNNHISKKNKCPKCANKNVTTEEFIKKSQNIHGNKYDYSLVNYINNIDKVKIICFEHGIFNQSPSHHLLGNECPICSNSYKKTTDEFIEKSIKIHDDKYDYSLVEYTNAHEKVKIICKNHGIFEQTPNSHMNNNSGCPKCRESKGEKEIRKILDYNNIIFKSQKTFPKCKYKRKLKFDFYLPDYNIAIEYDGEQHFRPYRFYKSNKDFIELKKRDEIKNIYCKDNNIKLIRISYKDNINEKMNILLNDY